MVNSMTGFGRGTAQNENYSITVEIKAVNHRFLEIYTKLPKQMLSREDALKKQLQNKLSRGKLDVFVSFEQIAAKNTVVKVDKALLMAYHKALTEVAECCDIKPEIKLHSLASFNGVLSLDTVEDDEEEITVLFSQAVEEALQTLLDMRSKEGAVLKADLLPRLSYVEDHARQIQAFAPEVVRMQKQRLEQRIADLLGAVAVDEARLANEIAFFADKVDITEELTRLSSHVKQFELTLESDEAIGRKLDFILQEMLREINTIGSKSNALNINQLVIEVKSELEKIREQIQNVE